MHCFTGDAAQAEQALDMGFHLAFGGVLTFKTAENVREAARITPDDRLLIETDAPYLAPVPWRGKRNEPSFMVETVRKLAEVRGTTPEAHRRHHHRQLRTACVCAHETRPVTLRFPMATERAGQILTAREIFELVREDLRSVEKAIDVESRRLG